MSNSENVCIVRGCIESTHDWVGYAIPRGDDCLRTWTDLFFRYLERYSAEDPSRSSEKTSSQVSLEEIVA
jgi:hypothetical protein